VLVALDAPCASLCHVLPINRLILRYNDVCEITKKRNADGASTYFIRLKKIANANIFRL